MNMTIATDLQIQMMNINTTSGNYWYFSKELADETGASLSGIGKALDKLASLEDAPVIVREVPHRTVNTISKEYCLKGYEQSSTTPEELAHSELIYVVKRIKNTAEKASLEDLQGAAKQIHELEKYFTKLEIAKRLNKPTHDSFVDER